MVRSLSRSYCQIYVFVPVFLSFCVLFFSLSLNFRIYSSPADNILIVNFFVKLMCEDTLFFLRRDDCYRLLPFTDRSASLFSFLFSVFILALLLVLLYG